MSEEWRPIVGWPEYEISNLGRVRRVETGAIRKPCNISGYQAVRLTRRGGKSKTVLIHREVARRFVKRPRRKGLQVNHKDNDRWNPRANNLEWVTGSENIKHGYRHGRINAKGSKNGHSKLTDERVFEIRRSSKSEHQHLADAYMVSIATIRDVAAGRTWKHLL